MDDESDEPRYDGLDDEDDLDDDVLGDVSYRERTGPGWAEIDGVRLDFNLRYVGHALESSLGIEPAAAAPDDWEAFHRWRVLREIAVADATEAATSDIANVPTRVPVRYDEGVDTAGPGGLPGDVLLFLLGEDPIGRLADLIAIGIGFKQTAAWLRDKTGHDVAFSDGAALLVMTPEVEAQFGASYTDIVAIQPLHPDDPDRFGLPNAYSITLSDDSYLYTGVVTSRGSLVSLVRLERANLTLPNLGEPEADEPARET